MLNLFVWAKVDIFFIKKLNHLIFLEKNELDESISNKVSFLSNEFCEFIKKLFISIDRILITNTF
jgi:hypothetical protein